MTCFRTHRAGAPGTRKPGGGGAPGVSPRLSGKVEDALPSRTRGAAQPLSPRWEVAPSLHRGGDQGSERSTGTGPLSSRLGGLPCGLRLCAAFLGAPPRAQAAFREARAWFLLIICCFVLFFVVLFLAPRAWSHFLCLPKVTAQLGDTRAGPGQGPRRVSSTCLLMAHPSLEFYHQGLSLSPHTGHKTKRITGVGTNQRMPGAQRKQGSHLQGSWGGAGGLVLPTSMNKGGRADSRAPGNAPPALVSIFVSGLRGPNLASTPPPD